VQSKKEKFNCHVKIIAALEKKRLTYLLNLIIIFYAFVSKCIRFKKIFSEVKI